MTVVEAAKEHGVSENTIYGWIAKKVEERRRSLKSSEAQKRERDQLLRTPRRDHLQALRHPKKEVKEDIGRVHQKHSGQELGVSRSSSCTTQKEAGEGLATQVSDRGGAPGASLIRFAPHRARAQEEPQGHRARDEALRHQGVPEAEAENGSREKKIQVIYAKPLAPRPCPCRTSTTCGPPTSPSCGGRKKKLYVATVIDLFTREIVGLSIGTEQGVALTHDSAWRRTLQRTRVPRSSTPTTAASTGHARSWGPSRRSAQRSRVRTRLARGRTDTRRASTTNSRSSSATRTVSLIRRTDRRGVPQIGLLQFRAHPHRAEDAAFSVCAPNENAPQWHIQGWCLKKGGNSNWSLPRTDYPRAEPLPQEHHPNNRDATAAQ